MIEDKNIPAGTSEERHTEPVSGLSLAFFFGGLTFVILLLVLLVEGGLSFLLLGLPIFREDGGLANGRLLVNLLLFASLAVGAVFALIFGRVITRPMNNIIDTVNRIAAGDFRARLTFPSALGRLPAAAELSGSVNTMAEELENTEMLRSDFINNFSHEFKTPIVSIVGFAKLLKSDSLTPEQRAEYIAIIEAEAMRLSVMATNVLSLTKVENQSILTDLTEFNLSEQIRTCFLLLEEKWSRKGLDLRLDFDEVNIVGNEELLQEVWLNLLDNAIKFADPGGYVSVTLTETGTDIRVEVVNSGSTVAPENRERIFRKFYQAERSHAGGGNGIGLAIVKRIVDLHHGKVFVTSGANFTTFTVLLPRDPVRPVAEEIK